MGKCSGNVEWKMEKDYRPGSQNLGRPVKAKLISKSVTCDRKRVCGDVIHLGIGIAHTTSMPKVLGTGALLRSLRLLKTIQTEIIQWHMRRSHLQSLVEPCGGKGFFLNSCTVHLISFPSCQKGIEHSTLVTA